LKGFPAADALMVQDIWLAVRVEAAATLALMSFWGWYCYYLTKLVVDCFCQKVDDKLVSIMVLGFTLDLDRK
jgi:hypothetical protein